MSFAPCAQRSSPDQPGTMSGTMTTTLRPPPEPPTRDALQAARAAGLRYVTDDQPGIRRLRAGKGFRYVGPDGKPVRDADTLRRIRSLVIPPAWTHVWICPRDD